MDEVRVRPHAASCCIKSRCATRPDIICSLETFHGSTLQQTSVKQHIVKAQWRKHWTWNLLMIFVILLTGDIFWFHVLEQIPFKDECVICCWVCCLPNAKPQTTESMTIISPSPREKTVLKWADTAEQLKAQICSLLATHTDSRRSQTKRC